MSHKQERRKQIFTKVSLKSLTIKVNLCQVQKLWKETRKIEETKNQFMRITLLKTVTISSCNLFRIYEAQQKAQQEMEMENKEDEMNSFLHLLRRYLSLCAARFVFDQPFRKVAYWHWAEGERFEPIKPSRTDLNWNCSLKWWKGRGSRVQFLCAKEEGYVIFFCCYALLIIFSQILMRIQSANEFYKTYVWKGSVWIV